MTLVQYTSRIRSFGRDSLCRVSSPPPLQPLCTYKALLACPV
jgi:hypothetical protein